MQTNSNKELYPLLFTPIYKDVMWGGKMLESYLDRETPQRKLPIGESWEIVDRDEENSIVENGALKGIKLRELINNYGTNLMGDKFQGEKFPLLVKIIDAGKRLSLQVHPDEKAIKDLPKAEPKTEMWYVIAAKENAQIIAGLNRKTTKREFVDKCQSKEVENCLQISKSHPGDAYYISAGTVHAIGAGNLLLEIQQNSDTTYRLSDWGRVSQDGTSRELHLEKGLKSINFTYRSSPKIAGVSSSAHHNRKFPIVQNCPYFRVYDLRLIEKWTTSTSSDSFHIITAINNPIFIHYNQTSIKVDKGRNCLIPANFGEYTIGVKGNKESTVILTTL